MAGKMQCALAVCVLGALLLASAVAAEQRNDGDVPAVVPGTNLKHRRALRVVVESVTGYWWWDTKVQSKVTLVPASTLHHKPPPAEKEEEEQLSTAHLKDVELPEWYKHKHGHDEDVEVVVVEKKDVKAQAGH